MKQIILLLTVILLCSCETPNDSKEILLNEFERINLQTVIIDGCEYFIGWQGVYSGYLFVHKGNCKNPIHYQNKITIIDTVEYQLIKK